MGLAIKCGECGSDMNEIEQDVYECPNCGLYLDYNEDEWCEDEIPEGCEACGGPYPDCMSSCKMFDE